MLSTPPTFLLGESLVSHLPVEKIRFSFSISSGNPIGFLLCVMSSASHTHSEYVYAYIR